MKIPGLTKNSHGIFWFRPSRKGLPAGSPEPKPIALGTRDEDEAIRKVLELRSQFVIPAPGDTSTVKQLVEAYLAHRQKTGKHRPRTTASAVGRLNHFADALAHKEVRAITKKDVAEWYASLDDGKRTNSTRHQYYRYVRAFFSWLVEEGKLGVNPAVRLRVPPPTQSRRDQFCSVAQREALIAGAGHYPELRLVLLMGFFLGLRIGEIVHARWDWFTEDFATCTVRNREGFLTKTGRERQIPVHSRLRTALQEMPRGEGFLLKPGHPPRKGWLRWSPREAFETLARRCGLPWVTFHTMRHTFASLHAIAGTPEIKVRRWMGITQATWDRHYAGLSPDDAAIEAI